ncbi:hypothetical protein LTR56_004489 [Elasticomyces elasticus]|nr:hypothetical protein LTR56_004489 [Elasticomyces elasticus]KAK3654223.1 hypothetical protein LTR22_010849 [Elasticomyces elasticus]KAK4920004.1 hypothetical protein LTR49_012442 [Elasticomyces elasticus]KAK5758838.1 hypothetical protein LTS12_011079 [Elasticomyces elasticus]
MAAATVWLRLPPAVRVAAFTRAIASRCAGLSPDSDKHSAISDIYDPSSSSYTADHEPLTEHEAPVNNDNSDTATLEKLAAVELQLWKRAQRRPFGESGRLWLKREIRAARKQPPTDAVATLEALLTHERFHKAPKTAPEPSARDPIDSAELARIVDVTALPNRSDYPDLPAELMGSTSIPEGFSKLCSMSKKRLEAEESYSAVSGKTAKHTCSLKISIPDVYSETLHATASTKKVARNAAWLTLLANMHANGSLVEMMRKDVDAVTPTATQPADKVDQSFTMPTKRDYPQAPGALFIASLIQNTIAGACGRRKIALQSDIDFSTKASRRRGALTHTCNLSLELEGVCNETAVADGVSKQECKHAAWMRMLAKLHLNGALAQLFSNSAPSSALPEEDWEDLQPAALSAEVMDEEKDAKVDIYNYAAGFGFVPAFTAAKVQPRARRVRAGHRAPTPKPVVRAKIAVPELGLEATGVGYTLQSAEIAAALTFKSQAEQQTNRPDAVVEQQNSDMHGVLNMDTAKHFFDYLRDVRRGLRIEMEHEQIKIASTSRQGARLSLDGEPLGESITMATKKQAEAVAYLAAAVHLSTKEPELLHGFEARLRKDKGKVLKQLSPVDLAVDPETLHLMRSGLIEAREAGLPDHEEALSAEAVVNVAQRQRRRRQQLTKAEIEALNATLIDSQQKFMEDPKLQELHEKKATLPMNQYRAQVIKMITENPYSIVVGATGSGKTTQVPQILLEHQIAQGEGGACNIVVTQPRRIAATSVAQRVAVERNEPLQQSVGYQVRFDAKIPEPGGSITYCTTGILLEQLKHDPDSILNVASHIVVDEVHERDIDIDFLMIILKRALSARQAAGKSVPKVVLMSATLDTELFANYFATTRADGEKQRCPSLKVPGRTFPVKDNFLGSIMHSLLQYPKAELDGVLAMDNTSQDFLKAETAFSKQYGYDVDASDSPTDSVIDWKREKQIVVGTQDVDTAAAEKEMGLVPTALLAATLAHICTTTEDGAVLAFLPGLEEILRTQRHLLAQPILGVDFGDTTKFKICLLHSTVPKEEQSQIFDPSPPGCRKIILSTNIAETSVTVTDVRYVIDAGKLRETRYDQLRRLTKLECVWESKSNSKQRAGRAGRVQNGYYYALFSKERHDSMRAIGLPELLRSDLQETLLSIKAQGFTDPVQTFLAQAIEPPPTAAVSAARASLEAIEAFTEDEKLTDLGRLLSKLPVHPTLGKMIVLGVIFRCLEPMLILGAAAEERSLFVTPMSREGKSTAETIRRNYAKDDSDHLAVLNAFMEIRTLRDQYGISTAWDRGRDQYIHMGAFRTIDQTARQILQVLEESGLIPRTHGGGRGESSYGPAAMNRNSDNPILVKSLLLAGYYPNLGAKVNPKGSTYRTTSEQNVLMHPSSLNDDSKRRTGKHDYGALFTYSTMGRSNDGSSLFMRDSTLVTPLMAALFGGKLHMSRSNRLDMDEWMPLFVQAHDRQFATKLILEFRKAINRVLNTAFRSLSASGSNQDSTFVDDPLREQFAQRVVEVLDHSSGRANANAFSRWR